MIPYDPEDATIKLKPDFVGIVEQSIAHLSPVISEIIELAANQARRACECEEGIKRRAEAGKLDMLDDGEICLPCEARRALNSLADVAERG